MYSVYVQCVRVRNARSEVADLLSLAVGVAAVVDVPGEVALSGSIKDLSRQTKTTK